MSAHSVLLFTDFTVWDRGVGYCRAKLVSSTSDKCSITQLRPRLPTLHYWLLFPIFNYKLCPCLPTLHYWLLFPIFNGSYEENELSHA